MPLTQPLAGVTNLQRLRATLGTAQTDDKIAITADATAWGTGASATFVAGSNDQRGQINVTVGSSPAASPAVVVTFKDGAWPTAPWVMLCRAGNGAFTWGVTGNTTTTFSVVYNGTPSGTVRFIYFVLG